MSTYPPALVDAVAYTLADQAYLAWVFDCVDDSHYHAWASTRRAFRDRAAAVLDVCAARGYDYRTKEAATP